MIPLNNFTLILLILIFFFFFFFFPSSLSLSNLSSPFINPTSVIPTKRNFSSSSSSSSSSSPLSSNQPSSIMGTSNLNTNNNPKKLRRLPHVFSKVLELPFNADFEVDIKEHPDCFKFVAEVVETDEIVSHGHGVRAHVVEFHPGITKVVIRTTDTRILRNVDDLEFDVWRFRLPGSARPDLATAAYAHGQLVVTVPKNNFRRGCECDCKGGGFEGNFGYPLLIPIY